MSFSLSLELLSYQKLPADQMLPGVDIRQSGSGEKEMVFTQNLLLEYANQTTQVSPRPAPRCSGQRKTNPDRTSEMRGAQVLTKGPVCLGRGLAGRGPCLS